MIVEIIIETNVVINFIINFVNNDSWLNKEGIKKKKKRKHNSNMSKNVSSPGVRVKLDRFNYNCIDRITRLSKGKDTNKPLRDFD